MRNYSFLLFTLLLLGTFAGVYGQEKTKRTMPKRVRSHEQLLLPPRDTVIMRGEEIEVGSYLHEKWQVSVEVVDFGKSKKSDLEKGFYVIKQKPRQTITYRLVIQHLNDDSRYRIDRTVYVAKNEEEKKQLEQRLKEKIEAERKQREEQKKAGKIVLDFSKLKK